MNIQQLGPDRLRVTLDSSDLDKYDLDYFSISKESSGTKRLLKEILALAQKTGFNAYRCKILIEVLPGKNSGCILYLTKTPLSSSQEKTRRNQTESRRESKYILCCGCLEDTIEALGRFKDYPDIPIKSSSLYDFDDKYHLIFSPVSLGLDRERFISLLASLSEYGNTESASPMREALLDEHGNAILKSRAVESFIRFFH